MSDEYGDELDPTVVKPQSPWIVLGVGALLTVLGAAGLGTGGVGSVIAIVVFVAGSATMSGLGVRFGGQWVDYDRDQRRMRHAAADFLRTAGDE
jgi:hypothetical protein